MRDGQGQVDQFYLSLVADQEIVRLDVAVDIALLVEVANPSAACSMIFGIR